MVHFPWRARGQLQTATSDHIVRRPACHSFAISLSWKSHWRYAMSRTWLSIRVDLIEGHGEPCWPRPGRIFAAARSHTFSQLADAIDDAFARWDRSHAREFRCHIAAGAASPISTSAAGTATTASLPSQRILGSLNFHRSGPAGDLPTDRPSPGPQRCSRRSAQLGHHQPAPGYDVRSHHQEDREL